MAILDRDLTVVEANSELLGLLNGSAKHLIGQHLKELLHPSIQQRVLRLFGQLAEGRCGHIATHAVLQRNANSAFTGRLTAVTVESPPQTVSTIVLLVSPDENPTPALKPLKNRLSGLNVKILEGIAAGNSTTQLASQLYLSRQGVEYHVSTMLRKFSVPNRAALVSKAYSAGMFSIGSWPPKILVEGLRQ
ncbi:LuxR C-terminal-related transcriptional regulator [Streptomyces sp. NPDC017529]|uniref:helix-turn-helix transcriptional regulator n=1 Tax=Streptomyces sp. NPDC017529 TaxID=3365000 RepID=UPI0037A1820B